MLAIAALDSLGPAESFCDARHADASFAPGPDDGASARRAPGTGASASHLEGSRSSISSRASSALQRNGSIQSSSWRIYNFQVIA